QGARLRLRPILMTSFAFILGCVPLWIATGAGAIARRELGTTVITGMLAATLLGAIATPALYVLVEKVAKRGKREPAKVEAEARVEQTRALARGDGWALAPSLSANAVGMRQRASVPGLGVATGDVFAPGISASWEVDLWGRLRRTQEASYQGFVASEEAQRG